MAAKAQLKETQEELRAETAGRKKLEEENTRLRLELNFWVKELEKMEELRQAEARLSELLRREETDRMKREMGQEVEMVKMEEQGNIKRLEQAVASEHEQWRREREELQRDLEKAEKQRDDIEREKLEIVATWREHTDGWAQKMWEMIDLLKDKAEETEKLRGTVEELRKEPETRRSCDEKPRNFFTRCFQRTDVREREQVQKETERLELQQEGSRARMAEMGEVMEALVEEMDELMRRYQAQRERLVSEKRMKNVKEERTEETEVQLIEDDGA